MKKIIGLGIVAAFFVIAVQAQAATFSVTTTDDEVDSATACTTTPSDCALREAIIESNNNGEDDTISLPTGTYTISKSTGSGDAVKDDLDITDAGKTLTITGAGASTTIIEESLTSRVIDVGTSALLTISGVTIKSGNISGTGGGGIRAGSGSTLSISNSIVKDNTTDKKGGGINSAGTLTVSNTTISGNSSSADDGGGIHVGDAAVSASITNSTISGNSAAGGGGGIKVTGTATPTLTLDHNTITNNTADSDSNVGATDWGGGLLIGELVGTITMRHNILTANTDNSNNGDDCLTGTSFTSSGYNLITDNTNGCLKNSSYTAASTDISGQSAGLASAGLTSNGGETSTHALSNTSVAVNAIPAATCVTVLGSTPRDQIGNSRTGYCDIGAYELQDTSAPTITLTGSTPVNQECATTYTDAGATVTDVIDDALTSSIVTNTSAVNVAILGAYTVTYNVSDLSLNAATQVTRTVNVVDTTAPTISLTGEASVTIAEDATYTDAGASAADTCTGDLSSSLTVVNPVDTAVPGVYTVTYDVSDASSNAATRVTRAVTVESHGQIETITKSKGDLILTYADASTATIQPFGGKKNFRAVLFSGADRLFLVTNGKKVKLYQDITVSDTLKINQKKLKRDYYRIGTASFFNDYTTGIMASAKKDLGKITVFRITAAFKLTQKAVKTIPIDNRTEMTLVTKAAKKLITATFGSKPETIFQLILKKNGKLNLK